MIRTLRLLAISGLVATAVYVLADHLTQVGPLPQLLSRGPVVPLLVLDVIGQTGFYLLFATGIIAIVACVQQQRRGWMAVFIILLVLSCYYVYLAFYTNLGVQLRFLLAPPPLVDWGGPELVAFIWPTLFAVAVLIFTFVRRPAVAAP
jgi:hypothetical protein